MNVRIRKMLLMLPVAAVLICTKAYSDVPFNHAILKLPFEVRKEEPWSQTFNSQEEWDVFYRSNQVPIYPVDSSDPVEAPDIDFDKYSIVAGGLGSSKSHSTIMVRYVIGVGQTTFLGAVILTPGVTCMVTAEINYPSIVILVPKLPEKLELHVSEIMDECE